VRNLKDTKKYEHITKIAEQLNAQDRLKLFEATLTSEGSFDNAINDCEIVLHTASPYTMEFKDAKKELVDPAIMGTMTVLNSCEKFNVRRVVLTSSVAAITDSPDSNHIYTELDWNDSSSVDRNPYYYSKVCAEREAWKFAKKQVNELKRKFELAVINPCVVIGPCFTKEINPSAKIIIGMLTGEFAGIMSLGWAFVDVRDVAKAHIAAMESNNIVFDYNTVEALPRFICSSGTLNMKEVVAMLAKHFPENKKNLPTYDMQCTMGDYIVKFASLFQPKGMRSYLQTNLGKYAHLNNGKIKQTLGMQFLETEQSIVDTIVDAKQWGHIPASK